MYYRRKLLLGILEEFEKPLNNTYFQKVIFLVTRKQEIKSFDFVPYKYGSFSFQANQDLVTLSKKDIIKNIVGQKSSIWELNSNDNYISQLKQEDRYAIIKTKKEVAHFTQKELVKYTYVNFPYWATKSQIANDILSKKEIEQVNSQKREITEPAFFTIGYEGISLETYLNKLIINDVKLLCDVRKNSLSMKYGFSKNQLKNACNSIGIEYVHIPQLGIESKKRTNLKTISDYKQLFDDYEKTTLIENHDFLIKVSELATKHNRIAITCFEKDPGMCHRSRVADSLKKIPDWTISQKNL